MCSDKKGAKRDIISQNEIFASIKGPHWTKNENIKVDLHITVTGEKPIRS
jgi:hypothetical protein